MVADPFDVPVSLAESLGQARSVGVITGAGISAASGITTYRGRGGIYEDPEEGDRTVEALSGPTLLADPDRTWRAVAHLALMTRAATPNPGHLALVELEIQMERFVLLTQNVDGLHERAGNRNIIDIHGSIERSSCMQCEAKGGAPEWTAALEATPLCERCGGPLRPDVVLFEEMLPVEKVARMQTELIDDVPDVVIAVGTTALFPYIAEPVVIARDMGRMTAEVNPERTVLSGVVEHHLCGGADIVLPAILEALR